MSVLTYGRIIGLSRQTLVNDDLGAFMDMATAAGRRAVDFENATFFALCILPAAGLGPNLSDGVAVYNSAHANVTGAGGLDNTRLDDAFAKITAQTSLDGLKLNLMPSILLVSPTNFGNAKRLTTQIQATQASAVNTFAGMLEPIFDANLSGTRFYVLANPDQLPQYVYGGLEGQAGPRFEIENGFRIDGVEFKLAIDFGCGPIDSRAGVTGAGA